MTNAARRTLAFAAALGVFALDRWSKWMVETRIAGDGAITVIPGFFNVVHSENPGVAFGILQDGTSHWQAAILISLSSLVILALAAILWRTPSQPGLALIFGGALGNVFDRIHAGHVTDFLDFYLGNYHWYTFNIADASIFTGACLLILGTFV